MNDLNKREEEVLRFWDENKVFEKSVELNKGKKEFVSFDGPPFANGLPHGGHFLVSSIKDSVLRYKNMKGFYAPRTWGWDCHGLPVENETSKKLNLKNKKDIEELGVEKFSEAALEGIFKYASVWEEKIRRLGRWVDIKNAYKTLDFTFTESVWNIFSILDKKNLVKKVFRVFHICPSCETNLANFEVSQGYKEIDCISVYVTFKLKNSNKKLLVWTTTPWTLPSNTAIAVSGDIDYVEVSLDGEIFIIAKVLADTVFKDTEHKIEKTFKGSELVGLEYEPIFKYFNDLNENAYKIYSAEYVTAEDGTGLVHTSPAHGADDYELSKKYDLPIVFALNQDGIFKDEVKDFAGLEVKPKDHHLSTDIEIIKKLSELGSLFKKHKIKHSYPHCWRCDSPLLNYATDSWVVEIPKVKDKLIKENKKIKWYPEHLRDGRFGNWLEDVNDWSISRSRYWGAPIPVWESKSGKRIIPESIKTLKKYIKHSNNKYVFVRHGQTEKNTNSLSDLNIVSASLTDLGKEQAVSGAKEIKKMFNNVDVVIASPMTRTQETAKIMVEKLDFKGNIITDERIREVASFGSKEQEKNKKYNNKCFFELEEIRKKHLVEHSENWHCKGELESYGETYSRIAEFLYDCESKYKDKTILIVSHSGVGFNMNLVSQGFAFTSVKEFIERYYDKYRHVGKNEHLTPFSIHGRPTVFDFKPLPHNKHYEIDLHKPYIDRVVLEKDGEEYHRIEHVFDCWFESGSMPFAQHHYPFNKASGFSPKFPKKRYPADFIVEGLDQTRGWFYLLLAVATSAFGSSSFKSVVTTGLLAGNDGKKFSKSLGNFTDPTKLIESYGADAYRLYLVSSPLVRGEDTVFLDEAVDNVRKKIINRLLNCVSFFNIIQTKKIAKDLNTTDPLDNWIVSRLHEVLKTIGDEMDEYHLDKATRPINDFIDDLSTWYLRRSRERLRLDSEDGENARKVFLYCLEETAKMMAPFTPFSAEMIYMDLGKTESVHLEHWSKVGHIDKNIIEEMKVVRNAVSEFLLLRSKEQIKTRQPLQTATLNESMKSVISKYEDIIKEEINVKFIEYSESDTFALDTNITKELKEEGAVRDIVRAIQDRRKLMNLDQSDMINIKLSEEYKAIFESQLDFIKSQTNSVNVSYEKTLSESVKTDIGDLSFEVSV